MSPTRVLAIYAHPDDADVGCAGTLARWADEGSDIHLVVCTLGEKGTIDGTIDPEALAARRADEVAAAAEVIGVSAIENLGYPDGEFANDLEARALLVERIRTVRPDVVLTSDPTAVIIGGGYVNHHDHRTVGFAVLDACSPAAARPLYFPDAGPPHQVEAIYLSGTLEPDTWIDIQTTIDRKIAAIRCHHSQLGDDADLMDELVRGRAAAAGIDGGMDAAESFRVVRLG